MITRNKLGFKIKTLDKDIDSLEDELINLYKNRKDIYRKIIIAFLTRSIGGYYYRKELLLKRFFELNESIKKIKNKLKPLTKEQDKLINELAKLK